MARDGALSPGCGKIIPYKHFLKMNLRGNVRDGLIKDNYLTEHDRNKVPIQARWPQGIIPKPRRAQTVGRDPLFDWTTRESFQREI